MKKQFMYQNLTLDTIRFRLAKTADWRREKATAYQDDPRNISAEKQLRKLAAEDSGGVELSLWSELEPFATSLTLRDAINVASREVGFRTNPKDLSDFLASVVSKLPAAH